MKQTNVKIANVDPALIDPNRYRNFELNPLVADQIARLHASFDRNGQKGALTVRPLSNGRYELGSGHHRLAAMGGLKHLVPAGAQTHSPKTVRVSIEDLDEDGMIRWLMDENLSQRDGGASPAVDADSVGAAIHRLAYLLISGADAPAWMIGEEVPSQGGTQPSDLAWRQARGHLENGTGPGNRIIRAYMGDKCIPKHRLEVAVASLKALEHGGMADIVRNAREQYEAEVAAATEAEERRLEAIRQREEQMKREAEERKRQEAEQRKRDEAERKRLAKEREEVRAEAERKRQERQAQLKREAEERERREAAERARNAEIAQQRAAAAAAEQERIAKARAAEEAMRAKAREAGIHMTVFTDPELTASVLNAFNSVELRKSFTIDEQPALWADFKAMKLEPTGDHGGKHHLAGLYVKIRARLKAWGDVFKPAEHAQLAQDALSVTRAARGMHVPPFEDVVAYLAREQTKRDAQRRGMFEQWEREREAENWNRKAERVMRELGAAAGGFDSKLNAFAKLMDEASNDEAQRRFIVKEANIGSLPHNLDRLESTIHTLRDMLNLYQSSIAKSTIEVQQDQEVYRNVVDTQ